jgi:putative membrane protein
MKYTLGINTAIVVIGLAGAAFAETKTETKSSEKSHSLSSADKAFLKEAAKGGMMEVTMGRVAEKNATDAAVKKFGARMVADHGKANSELKSIATEEKVSLPGEKEAVKWKSDKEYMGMMVKDHEEDLAAFEKEAKEGSDPDVKRFAEKGSAMVRKHLQMAKEIDGKLK